MNRINRVTSILIQLQSKKIIPAKEIAQRFNISLRTVYRDIRTLTFCSILNKIYNNQEIVNLIFFCTSSNKSEGRYSLNCHCRLL